MSPVTDEEFPEREAEDRAGDWSEDMEDAVLHVAAFDHAVDLDGVKFASKWARVIADEISKRTREYGKPPGTMIEVALSKHDGFWAAELLQKRWRDVKETRVPNPEGIVQIVRDHLRHQHQARLVHHIADLWQAREYEQADAVIAQLAASRVGKSATSAVLAAPAYAEGPVYLVEPLVLAEGLSVLFSDGGVGKSLIALVLALLVVNGEPLRGTEIRARAATRVLYLDWENGRSTFEHRMRAVEVGTTTYPSAQKPLAFPPGSIHYRRMIGGLAEQIPEIKLYVAANEIGLVVVDTLAPATGDPSEVNLTIELLTALGDLGVPVLVLAHETKASAGKSDKPYGSVFNSNIPRSTWAVRVSEDSGVEDERGHVINYLGFIHHKANDTRKRHPLALRVEFREFETGRMERVIITRADYAEHFEPSDGPTLTDILSERGPLTIEDLMDATRKGRRAVEKQIERASKAGKVVRAGSRGRRALYGPPTSRSEHVGDEA